MMRLQTIKNQAINNSAFKKQQGGALLLTTVFLLVTMTLLTITNTNSSLINTRMTSNILDKSRSELAADSVARYAWNEVKLNYELGKFVENNKYAGHYDLRDAANKQTKTRDTWNKAKNTSSWKWNDKSKHDSMPNRLALSGINYNIANKNNPMQLAKAPQYIKGIGDPVMRHGTESFYCVPVSIIGAAEGTSSKTKSLVEIKVIPKKGCFRNLVK